MVVSWLGGFGQMLRTQRLTRRDVGAIWDDRVLLRAFEVFGGVPRVEVADPDGSLPPALNDQLTRAVALAG